MAFEDVEAAVDKYWSPEKVGDFIEGNVYDITKDQWNKKRIELDLGDDESGNMISTILPPHAHLQKFIPNVEIGDFIRVTLIELKDPTEEQLKEDPNRKPTFIYKVQKDPDRAMDYADE